MSDFLLFTDWDRASEDAALPEHSTTEVQPLHEMYTMEGSEFPDDALRMKDQPLLSNGS